VGAYQITPVAMDAAMKAAGVNDNTIFSPTVQDRMGLGLILGSKRPKLAAYIKGESDDINTAMLEFAKEFASVPDPNTGRSYYDNTGNKAQHTVEETREALQRARQAYSEGILTEQMPDQQTTDQTGITESPRPAPSPLGNTMPRPDDEMLANAWDTLYSGTHDPETGQLIQ